MRQPDILLDEEEDMAYEHELRCQTCLGDGHTECDDDCPDSDDCGCPYGRRHFITCPNCHGTGKAKDQWYW